MPLLPKRCPNCNKLVEDITLVESCLYYTDWNPLEGSGDGEHDNYDLDHYECPKCNNSLSMEWREQWENECIEASEEEAIEIRRQLEQQNIQETRRNRGNNIFTNIPIPPIKMKSKNKNEYEENDINELSAKKARNPHNNITQEERNEYYQEYLLECPNCGYNIITKNNDKTKCARCNHIFETLGNEVPYATSI